MKIKSAFLVVCALLFAGNLFSQDVPAGYRIEYYYRIKADSASSATVSPNKKLKKLLTQDGCVFIDSLSFVAETQNGYDSIWNTNKKLQVHSFFVHGTEVSNAEYSDFLRLHPASAYYPDTNVWKNPDGDDHPYVHYYFQHRAYSNYPVLGVNHWQAEQFCKWKQEMLQKQLTDIGIKDYRIAVDLPSEAEWQSTFSCLFPKWLQMQKTKGTSLSGNSTNYVIGTGGYRANFGALQSQRLQNIRLTYQSKSNLLSDGIPLACRSNPSVFGVYNLLGNAAEWTSTSAANNLFNTEQYMYTFSEKIIPKKITPTDSAALSKRLHDSTTMTHYFAVKGGSWREEFFYLQPAALQFREQMYRANNIGFRYVVRVYYVGK